MARTPRERVSQMNAFYRFWLKSRRVEHGLLICKLLTLVFLTTVSVTSAGTTSCQLHGFCSRLRNSFQPAGAARLSAQLLLSAASTWFLSKSFRQEFSDAAVKNDHHFPSSFPLLWLVKEQRETPSFPRTSPEVSFTENVGLGGLVSRKTSPRFLRGLAW